MNVGISFNIELVNNVVTYFCKMFSFHFITNFLLFSLFFVKGGPETEINIYKDLVFSNSSIQMLKIDQFDLLEEKYGRIVHASIIFRHGDRTPDAEAVTYPFDPHKNHSWPIDESGEGELTRVGKMNMFELGKWFHTRYVNLTGKTFLLGKVKFHSSDTERNIISALCFAHGMFPLDEHTRWRDGENWHPVPIHTIPGKYDKIHLPTRICSRLKQRRNIIYFSPEGQQIYREYKNLLKFIEKHSGIPLSNLTVGMKFHRLRNLQTILKIQSKNNLTLPKWTEKIYPQPIKMIVERTIKLETSDPFWKRLSGGPILESILNDILKKIQSPSFKQVIHLYAGHEKTIESLLSVFNISAIINGTRAQFGTSLMIELRIKENQYFVTTVLRNSEDNEVYIYDLPNCGFSCPLEKYYQFSIPFIPLNWNDECQEISSSTKDNDSSTHIYSIMILILFRYLV